MCPHVSACVLCLDAVVQLTVSLSPRHLVTPSPHHPVSSSPRLLVSSSPCHDVDFHHCLLSGCSLLFYETYGKSGAAEQELSPRYVLLADDSIVQAVPEHPRREHVFCLSNAYGDVYLFQVRGALTTAGSQRVHLFLKSVSTFSFKCESKCQRSAGSVLFF